MSKPVLAYGYNRGLPDTATTAWGARWLVHQDGMVDEVHDRTDFQPTESTDDKERLRDHLIAHVLGLPKDNLRERLRNGSIRTDSDGEFVLYDDGHVRVVGSPQGSGGYFYVAAFFTPAADADLPADLDFYAWRVGQDDEGKLTRGGLTDIARYVEPEPPLAGDKRLAGQIFPDVVEACAFLFDHGYIRKAEDERWVLVHYTGEIITTMKET